ncbi:MULTISPECIES: LysR substrate-binding domain-containing protein [Burkholderia]|uniref:LysR family transcriptional regulator n=2 Tax=Burkholderia humptydooensis TaxID=430531 RepID=A0A7U4PAK8_9BURK|nr:MULTISPECIES: LysR substrate-binding domain-containing protein [Burkholderia]AGK49982.1 bacterial regulatory helix-turn-helix, lysR family protein [Burkholderia thailandensis MSMB121]ATF32999.1 LysR family transcriptional regulator [Burkholderia thailandensis]ALX46020.1 LysR family transcriptional regulator [Burkholderia humptydooensis]EIP87026.1 transcriptional regulator, LysR family, putative [Burkholderia humptydooensis MSMB43]KST70823.1 LysR family transcriptional regulator [Burkholderi
MPTTLPTTLDTHPRAIRSRLKTRQLLLIVALADEGNIHRAAAALNMTQPAASKLLRELEDTIGAMLFERMPRGMRPTLYGDALIRHARAALGSLDQAQDELAALKAGRLGHVAIGAITSPGLRLLPPAVAAVKATHANVRISVEIDTSNVLLERLAQDKLDVVVGRLSAEHDKLRLRYAPLTGEPVAAVVRAGHPLLERAPLTLADVQRAAWVVPPAGSVLRHRFELMFQRASLTPPANVVETAALLFVTRVLERSDMIAVLAEDVARYYATHGIVAMLPLEMDCRMDDFGIITRTDKVYAPAASVTIDAIRDAAREIYGVAAA